LSILAYVMSIADAHSMDPSFVTTIVDQIYLMNDDSDGFYLGCDAM
jgi:hypothetical protein